MAHDHLEEAILDAQNGAAICFLGAGFSMGAKTAGGKMIPNVSMLSEEIWELVGHSPDPSVSLSELADYCEQVDDTKLALRDLIIRSFTACKPTDAQKTLMSLPWRAVFTTNFDDLAEVASENAQVVTPSFSIKNLNPHKRPIYHLHGRARDLLEGRDDPSLVLSETNYLQIKEKNRDLYAALENEVHTASRIFYVGYSIRDAEIASMLFSIAGLREKSIVIVGDQDSTFSVTRLKKFGDVYAVGLSGLSDLVLKTKNPGNSLNSRLNFVQRIEPEKIAREIDIDDVHRLILSGEFSYSSYARHMSDDTAADPYCVTRGAHVSKLFEVITSGRNRIVVSSDLGNGKTIFLGQVVYAAHQKGYEVIKIERQLTEVYQEIDRLLLEPKQKIFLIDDLIRYRSVAQYIGKRLPANSVLIATAGTVYDLRELGTVSDNLGGLVREIDINTLSSEELIAWDRFLERWGFWEEKIEETATDRISFLRTRCNAENRAIVVSLFKTSALSKKIHNIVQFFLNKHSNLAQSFIAILINSLCRHHVEWKRIVAWLNIDEDQLKKAILNSGVANFIEGSRRWYDFTSAELADFVLSRYDFDIDDLVSVYVKIVRETAYSSNDPRSGFDSRENLKELMRFRFLTRLFSNPSDGHATINAVYMRLSTVPKIRENDQFWLQYAMARMEIGDLDKAETFINTSLGIARKKGLDYSIRQIVDQRARLMFRKSAEQEHGYSKAEISQAIEDIVNALNDRDEIATHSLRASADILNLVEAKVDEFSQETIAELKHCLTLMQSKVPAGKLPKSQKGETQKIRGDINKGLVILNNY